MYRKAFSVGLLAASLSTSAHAGILNIEDVIVSDPLTGLGRMCVGGSCSLLENFPSTVFDGVMRMHADNNIIDFDDSSGSAFPDRDWRIQANEIDGGPDGEAFFIEDVTASTRPLYIEGPSPNNALFIASDGDIGLGTSLPLGDLHLVGSAVARLVFDPSAGSQWDIVTGSIGLSIQDQTNLSTPLHFDIGVPNNTIVARESGNMGFGTFDPESAIHILRSNNTARITVEETNASPASREQFRMENNGGTYFTLSNTNSGRDWFFNHEHASGGRFIITSSTDPAGGMFLTPGGDMTIGGTLTTSGGSCGGGCDAVFTEDYALPSIREHADAMWSLGYLPNVGPTIEHEPINVSDKLGRMLNELEHAHIYIDQLHKDATAREAQITAQLETQDAQIQMLLTRLQELEAE